MTEIVQNYLKRLESEPAQTIIDEINDKYPTGKTKDDVKLAKVRSALYIQEQKFEEARADLEFITKHEPKNAIAWDNLGVIYQMYGAYAHAAKAHRKAIEIDSTNSDIAFNLAVAYDKLGQKPMALKLYEAVISQRDDHIGAKINVAQIYNGMNNFQKALDMLETVSETAAEAHPNYWSAIAQTHKNMGNDDKALAYYTKAQDLSPDNPALAFAVAALKGETPDTPPKGFVSDLFDGFSSHYEEHLEKELQYAGPDLVYTAIEPHLGNDLVVADLGAGTGLFGKKIKDNVKTMVGVDVSQGMLDKAQDLGIYEELICNDIVSYLSEQDKERFDLVTAVDVLNYVGRLEKLFEQVARTLKKDGHFAFTVEKLDKGDVKLLESMRFAHSDDYIAGLAEKHGLSVVSQSEEQLRINKGAPIIGLIYVLKK